MTIFGVGRAIIKLIIINLDQSCINTGFQQKLCKFIAIFDVSGIDFKFPVFLTALSTYMQQFTEFHTEFGKNQG